MMGNSQHFDISNFGQLRDDVLDKEAAKLNAAAGSGMSSSAGNHTSDVAVAVAPGQEAAVVAVAPVQQAKKKRKKLLDDSDDD